MLRIPRETLPCELLLRDSLPDHLIIIFSLSTPSSHIACEDDQSVCVNLLLDTPGIDYKVENKAEKTVFDLCKPPLRRRLIDKLNLGVD